MSISPSFCRIEDLREPVVNADDRSSSPWKRKHFRTCTKIFNDPVHGQITLHPACVAIIDTPQFQRLRHIRQTGFTEHVYHGSSHNRFGHSLGVCYLAAKFLHELKERQPELQITETDILCVALAGLCHDLGHGPFSHVWEDFMKHSSSKRNTSMRWKHERVSANMFDYLIEENDLHPTLKQYGIGPEELALVKDYILGAKPKDSYKAYLYQIINNDDSGLDVDKFDYFLRDSLHLGLPCSFEYEHLMQYAKVFYVNDKAQICFRDKTLESVYNVFRTRSNLHRLAYQHKVSIIIQTILDQVQLDEKIYCGSDGFWFNSKFNCRDILFIDALEMVDDKIIGLDGKVQHFWEWSMSASYGQGEQLKSALEKFCMLTDDFVYTLLKLSPLPHLKKASELIKAIDKRSCKSEIFYRHVAMKILKHYRSEEDIFQGICSFLPSSQEFVLNNSFEDYENISPVSSNDISVLVIIVHWGKGAQNPVDMVHFYTKDNTYMKTCSEHLEVSVMPPKSYEEIQVHVLSRRSDDFALDVIRLCYDMYWENLSTKCNGHVE